MYAFRNKATTAMLDKVPRQVPCWSHRSARLHDGSRNPVGNTIGPPVIGLMARALPENSKLTDTSCTKHEVPPRVVLRTSEVIQMCRPKGKAVGVRRTRLGWAWTSVSSRSRISNFKHCTGNTQNASPTLLSQTTTDCPY